MAPREKTLTLREERPATPAPPESRQEFSGLEGIDVILSEPHATLKDLRRCRVFAPRPLQSLQAYGLCDVDLVLPRVDGSFLGYRLTNCSLLGSARQIRLHDSHDVCLSVTSPASPVVEGSRNILLCACGLLPRSTLFNEPVNSIVDFDNAGGVGVLNWRRGPSSVPRPVVVEASRGTILEDALTEHHRSQAQGIFGMNLATRLAAEPEVVASTAPQVLEEDDEI